MTRIISKDTISISAGLLVLLLLLFGGVVVLGTISFQPMDLVGRVKYRGYSP